nr:MAG: hypothetical protein 3 [Leviviridae sp.]
MLVKSLLIEIGRYLDLSVERDVATLQRRIEHEGLSFLTITLPLLSDSLERGLEEGRFTCPSNFARHGSLPRFLGGFFNRVFERTGKLLPNPCVESISSIRQICRFMKKLKISCTGDREAAAISHFKAVERELGQLTPSIRREDFILDKISRIIWSQVFPEIDSNEIVCQHGPGVTADRRLSNERYSIQFWYDRIEHTFPSDLHAFPNYGYACEASGMGDAGVSEGLRFLGLRDEPGVRIVFVPKTQTAPRVIAIEPSTMQYIQQGLLNYIVPRVEGHRLTNRSIRFSDQSINQDLAYRSSISGSLATLDLKDASDRVHLELVRRIFKGSGLLEFLEDARSLHATLPSGENLILNKFASMGSAICFPVEAMCFYTLLQSYFHLHDGRCPSSQSIRHYSNLIDIYGDDIIIPVDYTDGAVHYLESYGLKVNVSKSFRSSLFRESCGADYFNGQSVKPDYARQLAPDRVQHWTPEHVMAWKATADQLYLSGLWQTSQAVRDMVEEVLRTRVPRSRFDGPGIFFRSLLFDTNLRWNAQISGWEQRRLEYQPIKRKDDIDGDAVSCLNKWGITRHADDYRRTFRSHVVGSIGSDENCQTEGDSSDLLDPLEGSRETLSQLLTGNPSPQGETLKLAGISGSNDDVGQSESTQDLQSLLRAIGGGKSSFSTGPSTYRYIFPPRITPCDGDDLISDDEIIELDFTSSTKRGGFKSKRRWVTLIT